MNFFVTGTDTDIGKTFVTAGIACILADKGYKTGVFKPVQTGCAFLENGKLNSPDCDFVKKVNKNILTFSSYQFLEPAAPLIAADLENIEISLEKIKSDYENLKLKSDFVIVEGAGGILVPIKYDFSMKNLAKFLNLPVVIVARPDLGTINHTLLTIETLKSSKIPILGVIISDYPPETKDASIKQAPGIIEKISGEKILGIIPKISQISGDFGEFKTVFQKNLNLDFVF